jgi:transcription initiation factor IIE alpha subunit
MSTYGVPELVSNLVHVVGRAFYRDEHVVVLDHLCTLPFIRDDDLRRVFSLPEKQVRSILQNLQRERLVCMDEQVSERARKTGKLVNTKDEYERLEAKRRKREELHRGEEGKAGGGGRRADKEPHDSDGSDGSEGSDGEGEEGGELAGKRKRQRHKQTADCWYINPRYFVDVVKYRLFLIKRHLQRLENVGASYKCPQCPFEATLVEAINTCKQKGGFSSSSFSASSSASSSSASSSAPSAPPPLEFLCKWCDTKLVTRRTENVAVGAKELLLYL